MYRLTQPYHLESGSRRSCIETALERFHRLASQVEVPYFTRRIWGHLLQLHYLTETFLVDIDRMLTQSEDKDLLSEVKEACS